MYQGNIGTEKAKYMSETASNSFMLDYKNRPLCLISAFLPIMYPGSVGTPNARYTFETDWCRSRGSSLQAHKGHACISRIAPVAIVVIVVSWVIEFPTVWLQVVKRDDVGFFGRVI